jgi:hypothetical protein
MVQPGEQNLSSLLFSFCSADTWRFEKVGLSISVMVLSDTSLVQKFLLVLHSSCRATGAARLPTGGLLLYWQMNKTSTFVRYPAAVPGRRTSIGLLYNQ